MDLAPSIVIDRRRMSKERLPAIFSGSIRTKGQVVRSRDRFSAFECKGEGVKSSSRSAGGRDEWANGNAGDLGKNCTLGDVEGWKG